MDNVDRKMDLEELLAKNPTAEPQKVRESLEQLRDLEILGVPVDPGYRLSSPFSMALPNRSQKSVH